jgi:hypothetical protein
MIDVQYPPPSFRMKKDGDKQYVFDGIRKTWLLLTEEEWVRQNFISYLTNTLQYPSTMIAVEKEITLVELKKRFDVLVYNSSHRPWLMVECKAPQVSLNELVLQQVLRYNLSTPVAYLIITNGDSTVGWKKEGSNLKLIQQLPSWQ